MEPPEIPENQMQGRTPAIPSFAKIHQKMCMKSTELPVAIVNQGCVNAVQSPSA